MPNRRPVLKNDSYKSISLKMWEKNRDWARLFVAEYDITLRSQVSGHAGFAHLGVLARPEGRKIYVQVFGQDSGAILENSAPSPSPDVAEEPFFWSEVSVSDINAKSILA